MQKDPDLDRWLMVSEVALASAEQEKGSALTDEEIEGVMHWVLCWVLAMAQGMGPVTAANAMRAEANGAATIH